MREFDIKSSYQSAYMYDWRPWGYKVAAAVGAPCAR